MSDVSFLVLRKVSLESIPFEKFEISGNVCNFCRLTDITHAQTHLGVKGLIAK
jgi:hypothetical protein